MQYNPMPWLVDPPKSDRNYAEDPFMFRYAQSKDVELVEQQIKTEIQKLYNKLWLLQEEKNFIAQNLLTPISVKILVEIVHACTHFDDGIFYEDLRKRFSNLPYYTWVQSLRRLEQQGLVVSKGAFRVRRVKATEVGTGVASLLGADLPSE